MLNIYKKNLTKKGFTLIELIVVIAIIGVLAGILVPSMMGYIRKAKRLSDVNSARIIAENIEMFIATDDEAYNAFFCQTKGFKYGNNPGSNANNNITTKWTPYKFMIVMKMDGVKNAKQYKAQWTGADGSDSNSSDEDIKSMGRNGKFCQMFNEESGYKSGDNSVKIPLKLKLQQKDGNHYTFDRWIVGYRMDTMQIEVWVGQSKGTWGTGDKLIRLYPDPQTQYR